MNMTRSSQAAGAGGVPSSTSLDLSIGTTPTFLRPPTGVSSPERSSSELPPTVGTDNEGPIRAAASPEVVPPRMFRTGTAALLSVRFAPAQLLARALKSRGTAREPCLLRHGSHTGGGDPRLPGSRTDPPRGDERHRRYLR